jgi:hypothetical protein
MYVLHKLLKHSDDDELDTFYYHYSRSIFLNHYKFILLDKNNNHKHFYNDTDNFDYEFNDYLIKIIIDKDFITIENKGLFNIPYNLKISSNMLDIINKIYNSNQEYKPNIFNKKCSYFKKKYHFYDLSIDKFTDDYNYIDNIGLKLVKMDK